jgi:hypothetical protein
VTLARAVVGAALAGQIAGAAPDAIVLAYQRAAACLPVSALDGTRRGRRDLLAWQISFSDLSSTQRAVYFGIL